MEFQSCDSITSERQNVLRHLRTKSDILQTNNRSEHVSNGIKAVHTVTGALQNLFKRTSSPLTKGFVYCEK